MYEKIVDFSLVESQKKNVKKIALLLDLYYLTRRYRFVDTKNNQLQLRNESASNLRTIFFYKILEGKDKQFVLYLWMTE